MFIISTPTQEEIDRVTPEGGVGAEVRIARAEGVHGEAIIVAGNGQKRVTGTLLVDGAEQESRTFNSPVKIEASEVDVGTVLVVITKFDGEVLASAGVS